MFVDTALLTMLGQRCPESQNFAPLKMVIRDVVSCPSTLSGSFQLYQQDLLYEVRAPATARLAVPAAGSVFDVTPLWRAKTFDGVFTQVEKPIANLPPADLPSTQAAAAAAALLRPRGALPLLKRAATLDERFVSATIKPAAVGLGAAAPLAGASLASSMLLEPPRKRPLLTDGATTAEGAVPSPSPARRAMEPPLRTAPDVGPLLSCDLLLSSSGIDVVGLHHAYAAIARGYNPEVATALVDAEAAFLDTLEPYTHVLTEPDSIRSLLIAFMLPTHAKPAISAATVARLCANILALPQASRDRLISWLGADVPGPIMNERIVQMLQGHLSYHLRFIVSGRAVETFARVRGPATTPASGDGSGTPSNASSRPARATGGQGTSTAGVVGSAEGGISHIVALSLIIRVLRLLYNKNESLMREAQERLIDTLSQRASAPPQDAMAWAEAISATALGESEPAAAGATDLPLGAIVAPSAFYNRDLCQLPDGLLQTDYQRWRQAGFTRTVQTPIILCGYPFLLDAAAKRRILQFEAAIQMQMEATNALARSFFMESPYLVLQVRRDRLLSDTLNQLLAHPPSALKKPLKVVFIGEEGIDAGGVSKELFQLLVRDLFDPQYGMFVLQSPHHHYWFNPAALQEPKEFALVGLVLGLAIYNGIILDVRFPHAVYKKLLGQPVTLADMRGVNPELARGLEQLLQYPGDDVEDVFSLTFEASYESFGEAVAVELKPGGKDEPVTAANKIEYVKAYVDWYMNKSIGKEFHEFMRGFLLVMNGPALTLFRPEEVELLVAGDEHLDFKELERAATYEGGYHPAHPTVRAFWNVVHALPPDLQQKLLVFTTGSPRAPIGGLGNMPFKIQRAGPDSDRLPTASTCFNTLLLNDYGTDEEKMRDRLVRAISECAGFGLK